jgi:hypothetical protein
MITCGSLAAASLTPAPAPHAAQLRSKLLLVERG